MTIQLLGLLSAAALATTGLGATSETRSTQALPAQNMVVVPLSAGSSGKFHSVSRLADATTTPSDESSCKRDGGHWDSKKLRCVKGVFWLDPGARIVIGAGTVAGIIVAATESNGNSESSDNSISK